MRTGMHHPVRSLPVVSHSSLTEFRRCPKEYYFSHVMKRVSKYRSYSLRFGDLIHVGLNEWWMSAGTPKEKLICATGALCSKVSSNSEEYNEFDYVKAVALMVGYTAHWGQCDYETLEVEKEFTLPIMQTSDDEEHTFDTGYKIKGRIDAIVRDSEGKVYNVEHKTTSKDISYASDYWKHIYSLDSQVSMYDIASKMMGYDTVSTIYDVIRKPELLPYKATVNPKWTRPTKNDPIPHLYKGQHESDESPEEYHKRLLVDVSSRPSWYFARKNIVRLESDNNLHIEEVLSTCKHIHVREVDETWPRHPGACLRYNSYCTYHDVCTGCASIEDDSRYISKDK